MTGKDPTQFNPSDPLRLWIIQVGQSIVPKVFSQHRSHAPVTGIIIIMTQVLSIALRKLRQPRVIAEVLGGILLGASPALPTVSLS